MQPRLLVLSSLFPSGVQPSAGLFIRERMFRVGRVRPIVVVAPQPWFPGQSLIRRFRPHFRPMAPVRETMDGVEVHRPRFFSVPGLFKRFDGVLMALGAASTVRRLVRGQHVNVIDAHFGYPDGNAARWLARWFGLPMVLTLRGKEARQAASNLRAPLAAAVRAADRVITVSSALQAVALELGADPARIQVIGNGIDLAKFRPIPRPDARRRLNLPADARVLVTVGTLVERKGFHRVIDVMPRLLASLPDVHYLVVGGAGPEGDDSGQLHRRVAELGLHERVHFLGPVPPESLHVALSAADVFVLASRYEGWANVLLEAMACGLPVVATDVGGNAEVVAHPGLGRIVPFGEPDALASALHDALHADWDRREIRAYAESNAWEARIPQVVGVFDRLLGYREIRSTLGRSRSRLRTACMCYASKAARRSMRRRRSRRTMLASVARAALDIALPGGAGARLSVLAYHRVLPAPDPLLPFDPSVEEFEQTMRWVKATFNVLPLAEGVAGLRNGKLPRRALAITFDDGYANNATLAAPILARPACTRPSSSLPGISTAAACSTTPCWRPCEPRRAPNSILSRSASERTRSFRTATGCGPSRTSSARSNTGPWPNASRSASGSRNAPARPCPPT